MFGLKEDSKCKDSCFYNLGQCTIEASVCSPVHLMLLTLAAEGA